jgi:hypothetical protein
MQYVSKIFKSLTLLAIKPYFKDTIIYRMNMAIVSIAMIVINTGSKLVVAK